MERVMLTCNCCHQRITPATIDREHVYTLSLYELVTLAGGERAALRFGIARRAVCTDCVTRIEAAHRARRRRRSRLARVAV